MRMRGGFFSKYVTYGMVWYGRGLCMYAWKKRFGPGTTDRDSIQKMLLLSHHQKNPKPKLEKFNRLKHDIIIGYEVNYLLLF